MNINDIYELAKDIVKKANDLKNKYTNEVNAKVSYVAIFCKNDEEFNNYIKILKNDNNEVVDDTYSGPVFKINSLETVSGTLKLLKIRRYDDKHLDLGDADFNVSNYEEFKNKYVNKPNFNLISREDYEMIELMEDGYEVRAYFSNPPLDEELGIK